MIDWRIGRGWSEAALKERLAQIATAKRNFDDAEDGMTPEHGWQKYFSEATVGAEAPGVVEENGPFSRGRTAITRYEFSDPAIVVGHFDQETPLLGRNVLLEMKALRLLHYLGGVRISAVRSEGSDEETIFGFRYETLEGHIERGIEWFLLTKDHKTGRIRFRIEAAWQPGQFPNWWSRLGFSLLGERYQYHWHRRAHEYLAEIMRDPDAEPSGKGGGRLSHTEQLHFEFKRIKAKHVR